MDWNDVAVQFVVAVTPVLTMVALWGLKLAWSKIPASIVLFAAPVAGIVLNFALNYLLGHPPASPVVAALLGALAVVIREFISTLSTKGLSGSVSVTKGMF